MNSVTLSLILVMIASSPRAYGEDDIGAANVQVPGPSLGPIQVPREEYNFVLQNLLKWEKNNESGTSTTEVPEVSTKNDSSWRPVPDEANREILQRTNNVLKFNKNAGFNERFGRANYIYQAFEKISSGDTHYIVAFSTKDLNSANEICLIRFKISGNAQEPPKTNKAICIDTPKKWIEEYEKTFPGRNKIAEPHWNKLPSDALRPLLTLTKEVVNSQNIKSHRVDAIISAESLNFPGGEWYIVVSKYGDDKKCITLFLFPVPKGMAKIRPTQLKTLEDVFATGPFMECVVSVDHYLHNWLQVPLTDGLYNDNRARMKSKMMVFPREVNT